MCNGGAGWSGSKAIFLDIREKKVLQQAEVRTGPRGHPLTFVPSKHDNSMLSDSSASRYPLTIAALALCMAAVFQMNAQQNALKITPLEPVLGKLSFSYERALDSRTTLLLEAQNWFETRSTHSAPFFPVLLATSSQTVRNTGMRWALYGRRYTQSALKGGFVEAGAFTGKHQIKTEEEISVLIFWSESSQEQFKNVRVNGFRLGAGLQRGKGHFTYEISGGFSINHNSQRVYSSLGMKPFSPYGRLAIGARF